jgi:hypothetical protein
MIAVELIRMVFSALPTGPTGSKRPLLHAQVSRVRPATSGARLQLPRWIRLLLK